MGGAARVLGRVSKITALRERTARHGCSDTQRQDVLPPNAGIQLWKSDEMEGTLR